MRKTSALGIGVGIVLAVVGVAWASGNWSEAQSRAAEFKSRYEDLRKLTPEETRKIVSAVCEADDGKRKDAGREASDRVKGEVADKSSELEQIKNDATKLLDDVMSDDNLKDKAEDARSLKEDVANRWESIQRMTKSLRGANHPVVAYMLEQGKQAHKSYEEHCDAKEVAVADGQADCVMASGETCLVIEVKPDNSRAIDRGKDQARRYRDDLNAELAKPDSDVMKRLKDQKSDFEKCKRFEFRIDCYKLCPDISEDNEFREVSPTWRSDCG